MTKPVKIGGSVNETFNLGALTKKSSADKKISQNRKISRQSGDVTRFSKILLTDRRPTVGLGNVTVVTSNHSTPTPPLTSVVRLPTTG